MFLLKRKDSNYMFGTRGSQYHQYFKRLGCHLAAVRKHIAAFKKLPLTLLPCSSRRGLALRGS
jgi:hypothetical protein